MHALLKISKTSYLLLHRAEKESVSKRPVCVFVRERERGGGKRERERERESAFKKSIRIGPTLERPLWGLSTY